MPRALVTSHWLLIISEMSPKPICTAYVRLNSLYLVNGAKGNDENRNDGCQPVPYLVVPSLAEDGINHALP